MAQVVPPEIMDILSLRDQFRASGVKATLAATTLALIDEIRGDIHSTEDSDGWIKIGAVGAGSGGGAPWSSKSFHHSGSKDAFRGINGGSRGGGGGGGGGGSGGYSGKSHSAFRSKFTYSKPSEVAGAPVASHIATATSAAPPPQVKQSVRYVSKFKNKEQTVESTIVNTIILNKLNKFSASNYNEVNEFLMEILGSGDTDFLADFMHLIFTKAAAEEIFCPLYAKLLSELSAKYPFLVEEMLSIYSKFLAIFDEIKEEGCANTEEFIKKNKEKKYRKGYSQFVTELYKHGVLSKDKFTITLHKIADNILLYSRADDHVQLVEEYAACFLCICKGISGNMICPDVLRDIIGPKLSVLLNNANVKTADYPSLTNKIRFALLDSKDFLGK